jgi:hypothetical protein
MFFLLIARAALQMPAAAALCCYLMRFAAT